MVNIFYKNLFTVVIRLLKSHGKLIVLGVPDRPLELLVFPLSHIIVIEDKLIVFASNHNITAVIDRLAKADVNTIKLL